jgi:Uma2 family endonuclease
MATVQTLTPADHGRRMTYDEYMAGDYLPGYHYELIDGRLYVSPLAGLPESRLERWLDWHLTTYSRAHPEVINFVSKARVFVPGRADVTVPEPDMAAYHDFPLSAPLEDVHWEDVSPVLVAEVLVEGEPDKDLVRNVELYLAVPSIREYWVIDGRDEPSRPSLIVHRRYRARWAVRTHAFGRTYRTRLLPGFELVIDPGR